MVYAALTEAADRGTLLLVDGGLLRYHPRRDGVVTVREVVVLPSARRQGVGRSLVAEVRRRHPAAVLRCKCPSESPAQAFWASLGWSAVGTAGSLVVWECPPN